MNSFQVVRKISGHQVTVSEPNVLTVVPRTEYSNDGFIQTTNSALEVMSSPDIIRRLSPRQSSPCSFECRKARNEKDFSPSGNGCILMWLVQLHAVYLYEDHSMLYRRPKLEKSNR